MKDKLGGIIMKDFVNLRLKMCLSLRDGDKEGKETKVTKRYIVTHTFKFDDCRNCLRASRIEM